MSKSQKFLPFEARMSYRKNGLIQITSPDDDLGGFFLTLKKGTESYEIASEALQSHGLMPAPALTGRGLTASEVKELRHSNDENVLLGVTQDGEPVYWQSLKSALYIAGRRSQAVGHGVRLNVKSGGTSFYTEWKPADFVHQREVDERTVFNGLNSGTSPHRHCAFLACHGHLTEDETRSLTERILRSNASKISIVFCDTSFDETTTSGVALKSQLSHLYTSGSDIVDESVWSRLPLNAAYWQPKGATEPILIELI